MKGNFALECEDQITGTISGTMSVPVPTFTITVPDVTISTPGGDLVIKIPAITVAPNPAALQVAFDGQIQAQETGRGSGTFSAEIIGTIESTVHLDGS